MKGVNLSEEFYAGILSNFGNKPEGKSKIDEKKVETKVTESKEVEAPEDHVCPLCESKLDKPLSDETLQEHVDYILSVINENFEVDEDSESLDEDEGLVESDEDNSEEATETKDEDQDDSGK